MEKEMLASGFLCPLGIDSLQETMNWMAVSTCMLMYEHSHSEQNLNARWGGLAAARLLKHVCHPPSKDEIYCVVVAWLKL